MRGVTSSPDAHRTICVDGELDLAGTMAPLRRGAGDPCMRLASGEVWRATRTPDGATTARLRHRAGRVDVEAWGPGAAWACEHAAAWAGLHDDDSGFDPVTPLLRDLWRRHRGTRTCRSGAVAEALVPTILEQKVVGAEARASWRALVRSLGEPAPGPAPLMLPPTAETLAATPTWTFHRADVERRRADTIVGAMQRSRWLDEGATLPLADAYERLVSLPGIGAWTAAEVAAIALGDADAVSVGDFHLKNVVAWAFLGERRGTDEQMLELLEPWSGHQLRVIRLLVRGVGHAPRRAPRARRRAIAGY